MNSLTTTQRPTRRLSFRSVGFAEFTQPDGLFVHDFVRIDLPFGSVVGAFAHFVTNEVLGELVLEAWFAETNEIGRVLPSSNPPNEDPAVKIAIGTPRSRRDALVMPIVWMSDSNHWMPPLEADLEIVAFGPNRTHLHVLGISQLPPGVAAYSDRASLEHRFTVAIVRHVLNALAAAIVGQVPVVAETPT